MSAFGLEQILAKYMHTATSTHFPFAFHTDLWLLQCGSPKKLSTFEHLEENDAMSGVEVESMYKAAQREKEEEADVPGIGFVAGVDKS